MPRFTKAASERIARCLVRAASVEWGPLASELHALAGEAALLECGAIAALAREGEAIARRAGPAAECDRVLASLAAEIRVLEAQSVA